jgi:hypothetical protein
MARSSLNDFKARSKLLLTTWPSNGRARPRSAAGLLEAAFPFVAHVAAAIFQLTTATAAAVEHLTLQRRCDDAVGDAGYATLVSEWHLTVDFELVVAAHDPV